MSPTAIVSFSRLAGLALLGALLFVTTAVAAQPTPPSVLAESVSGLAVTDAVLEAEVIPGSQGEGWDNEGTWEEAGGAWVQFQLVMDPVEYWPEVTCPEVSPEAPESQCLGPYGVVGGPEPPASPKRRSGDLPTTKLPGSTSAQPVALDLQSAGVTLNAGQTYHYRLVAVEALPTTDSIVWRTPPVYGPDQTFTVPGSETAAPLLAAVWSSAAASVPVAGDSGTRPRGRRCQRHKKNLRHQGIQCRRAAARPRKK